MSLATLLVAGCLAAPAEPAGDPADGDDTASDPAPGPCSSVFDDDFADEVQSASLWMPWEDGGTTSFMLDPGLVRFDAAGAAGSEAYADIWSLGTYPLAGAELVADFSAEVAGQAQATFSLEQSGGPLLRVYVWDGGFAVMTAANRDDSSTDHCGGECALFTGGAWRLRIRQVGDEVSIEALGPESGDWQLLAAVPALATEAAINVWVWASGDGSAAELELDRLQWLDCG